MKRKQCLLTTYVAGIKYQAYIPMLVYSCHKAYPEYDVMIFLHEDLAPQIRESLINAGLYDNVVIKENVYREECANMTSLQAKSCRWILWDDIFLNYDYLYIIDVDIFYIREPLALHLQHSKRMEETGLPFDNMRRYATLNRSVRGILKRIKTSGLHKIIRFLFEKDIREEKLSGLHFVDVKKYYTKNNINYFELVKNKLFRHYYFPEIMTSNNEVLLANMMKELGCNLSVLGVQTDSVTSLPFDDIYRSEFRPHHGFHLGIFAADCHITNDPTLDSDTYHYYLEQYKAIIKEEGFCVMYQNLPELAKSYLDRLHSYYKITYNTNQHNRD